MNRIEKIHSHPGMESKLGVDKYHVIVDRELLHQLYNEPQPNEEMAQCSHGLFVEGMCPECIAENEPQPDQTYTLNCDKCGIPYQCTEGFPVPQLCDSCKPDQSSRLLTDEVIEGKLDDWFSGLHEVFITQSGEAKRVKNFITNWDMKKELIKLFKEVKVETASIKDAEFALTFNPDYLDFQKGVEAEREIGKACIEALIEDINEKIWMVHHGIGRGSGRVSKDNLEYIRSLKANPTSEVEE